jgi:hypothetical protein
LTNRRPKSRVPVISSTLRFPTPYYLTLRPNPLSASCLLLSSSLLRGLYRLSLTGRKSRRTAAGGVDTGMSRHRLGLGLQKNPILVDGDDGEGYTESEPRSAPYRILSEDRYDMPQHDNTVLKSDNRPSARSVQALLSGSSTCTLQHSGGDYPRERSVKEISISC